MCVCVFMLHAGSSTKSTAPSLNDLTAPKGWAAAAAADSSSALDSSNKVMAKRQVKKQKQKAKVAKSAAVVKAAAKQTKKLRAVSQKGKPKQTAEKSLQQQRPLPQHRSAIMVYGKVADGDVRVELRLHEEPAAADTDPDDPGGCS